MDTQSKRKKQNRYESYQLRKTWRNILKDYKNYKYNYDDNFICNTSNTFKIIWRNPEIRDKIHIVAKKFCIIKECIKISAIDSDFERSILFKNSLRKPRLEFLQWMAKEGYKLLR